MKKSKKNKALELEKIAQREMNDICPHFKTSYDVPGCRNRTYEWKCFGHYRECKRFKTGDLSIPVSTYQDWEARK